MTKRRRRRRVLKKKKMGVEKKKNFDKSKTTRPMKRKKTALSFTEYNVE